MGEYVEVLVDDRPAPAQADQAPGTRSQLISYRTEEGFELARVHQYLRPDGSLGGSGRPDPKRVLFGGILHRLAKNPAL